MSLSQFAVSLGANEIDLIGTLRGEHVRLTHGGKAGRRFTRRPRAPFPIPICCGATRWRVLAASEQLGFRPNHRAPAAHAAFGVLLPSLLNPIFSCQLQAMERQARDAGYGLLVATSDYQPEREAAIVEHMLRQRVAGLVLTVADADNSAVLSTLQAWPAICAGA